MPWLLPGNDTLLFTVQRRTLEWSDARVVARAITGGSQKVLFENAADARYVDSGHLLFVRRGVLMAAPFNIETLDVTGGAVAIVDDVMQAVYNNSLESDSGQSSTACPRQGLSYMAREAPCL